jgi:uncharacterized membrane protein YgdD (TMEM256/DUF423 family)
MDQQKNFRQLATIGISGAIAVALGALGAHALKGQLAGGLITPDQLAGFDTGVRYQMYHTIAMLLVVLLQNHYSSRFFRYARILFLWGIVLFSGSLYLLCTRNLTGMDFLRFLGPVTPVGGLLFTAGWLCLCMPVFNKR